MLYDIGLTIAYDYDRPAVAGRHILRLMPADLPGVQRRITGLLTIMPEPAERRPFVDFFGNSAVEVAFRAEHDEILLRVTSRVERIAQSPVLDISPDLAGLAAEIADYREPRPRRPAPLPRREPAPRALPRDDRLRPRRDRPRHDRPPTPCAPSASRSTATCASTPTPPPSTRPPAEAFARRHGVCQDFAQVMIACLRGVGIPAAYVSGFLRTNPPPGRPRLEGADAMHAWVRAWCGRQTGWIEFDPTNAIPAGTDHIVVARGRDYGDVAPVKGILRIAGEQTSEHAVDVVPVG